MDNEIFRFEITEDDILTGRFTYTNRPNNNGYIFTQDAMAKAVAEYMVSSSVTYGHLGSDRDRMTNIDLAKTSHVLREIYEMESGFGIKVKVMDTPMGKALRELIESGVDLQFNGVYEGVINEETKEVEDLKFITIDIVPVK